MNDLEAKSLMEAIDSNRRIIGAAVLTLDKITNIIGKMQNQIDLLFRLQGLKK